MLSLLSIFFGIWFCFKGLGVFGLWMVLLGWFGLAASKSQSQILALQQVLDKASPYDKVVIVRSLLPSRDIGFLPGTLDEKANLYQDPYRILVKLLFELPSEQAFAELYDKLQAQGSLEFYSTSFLRGQTFDRAIIIVVFRTIMYV